MKKRIRIAVIAVSFLLSITLLFVFLDGIFLSKKYASVWSDRYIGQLENDQTRMIAYGIRAASSHNMQPWLVKLITSDTIELYADMDKALSVVDGDFKQLLMSQGSFIECYRNAASQYGYGVEIAYNEPDLSDKMPLIATIKVHKEATAAAIDMVSSSTFAPSNSGKNVDLQKTLDQCLAEYPGFTYTIVESTADVEKLETLLLEGTVIESEDEAATKELLDVFRWTEWEKNEYRYGLSLTSLPGLIKPIVEPIMKLSSNNWEAFGDSSIKQFEERLALQTQYILIKCENPSNSEYIKTGEILQKLVFEVSQYDLRPSMQLLETFDAMKNLNVQFQKEYGAQGEVVCIIGVQEKTSAPQASNPRHLVEDILIS